LKARAPVRLKALTQRLVRHGGPFRPAYLEATL